MTDQNHAAQPDPSRDEINQASVDLQEQLIEELDQLVERLKRILPDNISPEFTPQGFGRKIGENLKKISPGFAIEAFKRFGSVINEDLFDVDTWKGIWYVLNYSLESQADMLKRRVKGEYDIDEWGFDAELFQVVVPFITFMYEKYWRVQSLGLENIPDEGKALLVSNHSGQLPWDGAMVGAAIYLEHPSQRLVRTMFSPWLSSLPLISTLLVKLGQVPASEENALHLLEEDQIVTIFPEGYEGIGKTFRERYDILPFSQGNYIRSALATSAPIIPVAVVGAEETYFPPSRIPDFARNRVRPYFPISRTWPLFGLFGFIPLPTQWYIDFGEPIDAASYGPADVTNREQVSQLADQIRDVVQQMIARRLSARKSLVFGE